MGRFETANVIWPPVGWEQFAAVQSSSGQAVAKDISKARIYGLHYKIDSVPLFKNDTKLFRHDVEIDGWEYSILNESIEYPVLSFSLLDRFDLGLPREHFITNIRSYATSIPATNCSAARAVSAALFFIRQIAATQVPDVNRALRVYKLHPTQSFMYKDARPLEYNLKNAFRKERAAASKRF